MNIAYLYEYRGNNPLKRLKCREKRLASINHKFEGNVRFNESGIAEMLKKWSDNIEGQKK